MPANASCRSTGAALADWLAAAVPDRADGPLWQATSASVAATVAARRQVRVCVESFDRERDIRRFPSRLVMTTGAAPARLGLCGRPASITSNENHSHWMARPAPRGVRLPEAGLQAERLV